MGGGNHLTQIDQKACHLFSLFEDCEYEKDTTDTYRHHFCELLPVVSSPAFDSGHRVSCLAMRSKRNFLLQKRHSSSKLESESIALPSRTSRKTFPQKRWICKKKKKNTPAILNMSLAGKSTVKVDVFCFLKKSEIHCYTRAFDTSITILVMGEMNGLSFRKENYHPATVHFHNFSEKGNVVQSWLSYRMV